jgi:hypothetical protein
MRPHDPLVVGVGGTVLLNNHVYMQHWLAGQLLLALQALASGAATNMVLLGNTICEKALPKIAAKMRVFVIILICSCI